MAIAYVLQKTPYVFPIIGCRKIEQLQANIEALDVSLSPEQIKYLEGVLPFDPGFPHTMVVSILVTTDSATYRWVHRAMARSISAWCILQGTLTSGPEHKLSGCLEIKLADVFSVLV